MNKISAVNLTSCHQIAGSNTPFLLVLNRGENLIDSLVQSANIIKFPSAALLGIGALKDPTLGRYNFETQQHEARTFQGVYELTNLSGNITKDNNEYVSHIHVTLGDTADPNHQSLTGHLIDADIGILAEITVIPFQAEVTREFNPEYNGNTIKCE